MSEPKQTCTILSVEMISAYLGVVPGKARTALRNIANGGYAVEVDPGKWVRVISVEGTRIPKPRLKPGEGLVGAADSATSVADLAKILFAALPVSRRIQ